MLKWFLNQGLGIKFALLVVAILAMTSSIATFAYVKSQHQFQLESLITKGESLGRFVSLISPQSILTYDFEGMNDFMREASHEKDIVYSVLTSENGINLTQYLNTNNPYVSSATESTPQANILDIVQDLQKHSEIVPLEFPVSLEGKRIGNLLLGVSQKQANENYKEVLSGFFFVNTLIIIFLSACIYVAFRHMAIKPIGDLKRGLHRVSVGDLHGEIEVKSNDEIGELTRSFNDMVRRLKQTIEEKDDIAQRFQEQAADLARLNAHLEASVMEGNRIMRDLHDDVGAKLLSLVHRSKDDRNINLARSALQNLRETIRGLRQSETVMDVGDAMDEWQAEANDRLDPTGIRLEWNQPEKIPDLTLNNRQLINLSRILREAISNSIRHAVPSQIQVSTTIDDGHMQVTVCDNGKNGFDKEWEFGTGLNNMKRRATELEGSIHWFSAPEFDPQLSTGTCVEIKCPLHNGS